MPSVCDDTNTIIMLTTIQAPQQAPSLQSQLAVNNGMSNSTLSVNQPSDCPASSSVTATATATTTAATAQQITTGGPKSVNILLDYLLNSSRGGLISSSASNSNKLDVSNLAALAAFVDMRESGEVSVTNAGGGLNSPMDVNNNNQSMMLKNLLIDLVSPPLVPPSQFDLSSAGSSVEHLELQLNNYHGNDNSPSGGGYLSNGGGTARAQIVADSASFNVNFSGQQQQASNMMNKKQVKIIKILWQ